MESINWDQITEWDLKYCMHPFYTANELPQVVRCVEKVDQNFIHFADGSKALDLISGAMSCSGGLWHPRIASAIKEASDNFGFAAEMNPTRYKSTASKILVEDILGPDDWAGACRWVSSGSEAVEMALNIARRRSTMAWRRWTRCVTRRQARCSCFPY